MKSKTLWIVVGIATCFFIGTLANAAEMKYVDRPAAAVKKAEPQAKQRVRIDASWHHEIGARYHSLMKL